MDTISFEQILILSALSSEPSIQKHSDELVFRLYGRSDEKSARFSFPPVLWQDSCKSGCRYPAVRLPSLREMKQDKNSRAKAGRRKAQSTSEQNGRPKKCSHRFLSFCSGQGSWRCRLSCPTVMCSP